MQIQQSKQVQCHRCGGHGHMVKYATINNGVCYACKGKGTILGTRTLTQDEIASSLISVSFYDIEAIRERISNVARGELLAFVKTLLDSDLSTLSARVQLVSFATPLVFRETDGKAILERLTAALSTRIGQEPANDVEEGIRRMCRRLRG